MKRRVLDQDHFEACKRRAAAANAAGRQRARELGGVWGEDIVAGHCMVDGGPCAECEAEVAAARAAAAAG